MKIQCLKCKEIVPIGAFEPSADGVTIRCSACAGQFFLSKSGRASGERPREASGEPAPKAKGMDSADLEDGEVVCPKCSAVVAPDLPACTACGLLRDHFDNFAADAADAADPVLDELWETALGDWDNDDAHERFIARASSTGAYASAARRYRRASKDSPNDSVAAARLERIMKMAEVAILSARPPQAMDEGPSAYRGVVVMLVLILVVGAVAGIYAITKKGDSKPTRPAAPRSGPSTPGPSTPSLSTPSPDRNTNLKAGTKPKPRPSIDPRTTAPKQPEETR